MKSLVLLLSLLADPVDNSNSLIDQPKQRVFLPETVKASSHDLYDLRWPGPKLAPTRLRFFDKGFWRRR